MTEDNGTPTVDEQLAALVAPLHEHLQQIERRLREAQDAVTALREDRSKVKTVLRALDPTFEDETKPGRKGKRTTPANVASESATDTAAAYLEAHRAEFANGDGFYATQLARLKDWPHSQSYTAAILEALHQRGVVRLDQANGGPTGNSKVYVLV